MKSALNMIIFSLLLSSPVAAAGTLIAVASNGNQESSLVSRDPVHSDYYLVFADTGELLEVLDNPYRGGPKGAGKGVAEFLAQNKVDVVVAEYFSPALTREMESRGIRPVVFKGLAREAVRRLAATGNKKVTPSKGDNR
jgi:predicted Fe-Mo cluster-binding NifX family protein